MAWRGNVLVANAAAAPSAITATTCTGDSGGAARWLASCGTRSRNKLSLRRRLRKHAACLPVWAPFGLRLRLRACMGRGRRLGLYLWGARGSSS